MSIATQQNLIFIFYIAYIWIFIEYLSYTRELRERNVSSYKIAPRNLPTVRYILLAEHQAWARPRNVRYLIGVDRILL